MAEWTQEELRQGQRDIQSMDGAHVGWDNVAVRLACQRNLALWALNDVHDFLKSHGYDTTLIDSAIAACAEGK